MDCDVAPIGESEGGSTTVGTVGSVRTAGPVLAITPAFAFALVASVVAAFVLQRMFVAAHRTFGWILACSVVALLIDPVVEWLGRHMPRPLAIVVTLVALVGTAVLVVVRVITELSSSARALARVGPDAAVRLEGRSAVARDLRLVDTVRAMTKQLTKDLDQEAIARVRAAPTYLVTGILMLFLLIYGRRYISAAIAQISDEERRVEARRVVRVGLRRGRNRLLFTVLQILVVTMSGLAVFSALSLRAAFVLALVVGVASAIPFVGVLVAGTLPAVIAYGFDGLWPAVGVGVFIAVVELADVMWWRPYCDRSTVAVGTFLPLVAAIVGYRLYRVGGAVYGYAMVVLVLALIAAADVDGDGDPATWAEEPPSPVVAGASGGTVSDPSDEVD